MSPSFAFSNPVDTIQPCAPSSRSTWSTPSSTRTVRTITSSRTPSLASSTTSIHFSDDQRFAEDKLANTDIFARVDDGTPPMEATQKTLNIQTPRHAKKTTRLNKHHCRSIIQVLRASWFELRTFNDVTPEQFQYIVQEQNNHIYPKLYYDPDRFRITAMSPTPIHRHTIKFFTNCVRELVAPYESRQMQISHLQNSEIAGEEDSQNVRLDMRLDLEPRYGTFGDPITIWVGESGYSGLRTEMERKLNQTVQNAPSINAAFMIAIQNSESSKNFPRQHHLLSEPPLTMSAFTGPLIRPVTTLTDVKVGSVVWGALQSVEIFVFIRGNDGKFNFKVGKENPHAARGLLHPQIEVENITQLLNTASRQLLITIASIMESHDDKYHADIRDAAKTATFPIDWNFFLEDIQGSLYQTAFCNYKRWRHNGGKDLTAGSTKQSNRRRK